MRLIKFVLCTLVVSCMSCSEDVIFDLEENLRLERNEIDRFLQQNGIQAETALNDLRFRVVRQGTGATARVGDVMVYNYQVYGLDSTLLNTNLPDLQMDNPNVPNNITEPIMQPFFENIDLNILPEYLKYVVENFREETVVDLFLPSYLAFGNKRFYHVTGQNVPSNTPVLIQIEITEVIQ